MAHWFTLSAKNFEAHRIAESSEKNRERADQLLDCLLSVIRSDQQNPQSFQRVQAKLNAQIEKVGTADEICDSIRTFDLEKWKQVVLEPSNWAARAAVGLRAKGASAKRPRGARLDYPIDHIANLRGQWNSTFRAEKKDALSELVASAMGYEVNSYLFTEAAQMYLKVIRMAREVEPEGEMSPCFLSSCQSFINCAFLSKKSLLSDAFYPDMIKILAKLIRMSQTDGVVRIESDYLRDGIVQFGLVKLLDGTLTRLLEAARARHKNDLKPSYKQKKQLVYLWRYALCTERFWLHVSPVQHENLKSIHDLMVDYNQSIGLIAEPLPEMPAPTKGPQNIERFLQNTEHYGRYHAGVTEKDFLREIYARRGRPVGQVTKDQKSYSLLLLGPPGTGKTSCAYSLAHHLESPLVKIDSVDFKSKWFGESAIRLQTIISETIEFAKKSRLPNVVILLDELDGIGKKRTNNGDDSNSNDREILDVLLAQIEPNKLIYNFEAENGVVTVGEVIVVATCNLKKRLDDALVARFHKSLALPRWIPEKSTDLLKEIVASAVPFQDDKPRFMQFQTEEIVQVDTIKWLTRAAVSRMDLRSLLAATETFKTSNLALRDLNEEALSWLLFSKIAMKRIDGSSEDGSLIPNSNYQVKAQCRVKLGTHFTNRDVTINAFRISLKGLLESLGDGLLLKDHPFPVFFSMRNYKCLLVVHDLGISVSILEHKVYPLKTADFVVHRCFPGSDSIDHRRRFFESTLDDHQNVIENGIGPRALRLDDIKDQEKSQVFPTMRSLVCEVAARGNGNRPSSTFFKWSDIVEDALSFEHAKEALEDYDENGKTMTLELFTEKL